MPRPILVLNPINDQDFEDFATARLEPGITIAVFQDTLRTRYPRATVHRRELAGERQLLWYVYCDGHWVSGEKNGGARTV